VAILRKLRVALIGIAVLLLCASAASAYFPAPVNSPLNNMSLAGIVKVNGSRPPIGSELAVYNDSSKTALCGIFVLQEYEPGADWFNMVIAGDTGEFADPDGVSAGDCYVADAPLYFTLWDGTDEINQDDAGVTLEYGNNSYGSAYPSFPPVYEWMGYYYVDLNFVLGPVDNCPADPLKTEPGICGCGIADTDSDSDGTADCLDACPADPDKTAAGACGCGVVDTDGDLDGIVDCIDNCPVDANADQADCDSDGVGDVCDPDFPCASGVTITIPLEVGWNQISLPIAKVWYNGTLPTAPLADNLSPEPLTPLNAVFSAVFSSISGKYNLIRAYDGTTKNYDPTKPAFANTLKYIAGGYGYWIDMKEAATLVVTGPAMTASDSLQLSAGWNLVGYWHSDVQYLNPIPTAYFPAGMTYTLVPNMGTVLSSLSGNLTLVRGFDGTTKNYDPTKPAFANTLNYMGGGYGYWINIPVTGVLSY
jgi:hypothetical protein